MDLKDIRKGKGGWMKAQGRRWTPKEGEFLKGIFQKIERIKSQDPKKPDLMKYIIENDEGLEIIVHGTTVLDDLFKDIPVGYEVCLIFTGTKHNKPPLSPTKLFEVFYRPVQEDDESDLKPAATMNSHDPGEIAAFIQGVEQDLQDKGLPLIELNMMSEAKVQTEDDQQFWQLAKEAIRERNYPAKGD